MGSQKKVKKFVYKLVLPPNLAITFSDAEVGSADRVIKTDIHSTDSKLVRLYCANTQVTHFDGKCIEPNPIRKKEFRISANKKLCDLTLLESEFHAMVRSPAVATVFFSASEVRQMKGLVTYGKIGRLVPPDEKRKASDYDGYVYFTGKGGTTQFLIYSGERKPPCEPIPCVHRDFANHPATEDYFFALSFAKVSQVPLEDVSFRFGENGVVIIRGIKSGREVIMNVDQTSNRADIEREIDKLDQISEEGSFMAITPVGLLPIEHSSEKPIRPR